MAGGIGLLATSLKDENVATRSNARIINLMLWQ